MKVFEHFLRDSTSSQRKNRRGKRLETQMKYIILVVKFGSIYVRAVNNGLIEVKRHTVALRDFVHAF